MPLGYQIKTFAIAAVAATSLAGALPAQETQSPEVTAPMDGQVSDQMVEAFAAAAIEVQVIATDYASQIEAAADDSERERLIEEGNAEITQSIEEIEGITVDEYLQIAEAAAADEALNQRILQSVEAQMAE